MSDIDLAAIRARAESWHAITPADVPPLLALVDAQAARIERVLARHVPSPLWHDECRECSEMYPCDTRRDLTEDVAP